MQKLQINKKALNTIMLFIGAIGIFVAGLIYVLIADLYLKVRSSWLIIALLLCLGSSIFFILSVIFKEKRKKMIVFRSIGIAVCVCFIAYMAIYLTAAFNSTIEENTPEFRNNLFALEAIFGRTKRVNTTLCGAIPIVIGGIALIAQTFCLVTGILNKDED